METISVNELARRLNEILQRVARGEHFTITDHGRIAAELGPAGENRSTRGARTALDAILDIQQRVKPLGIPLRDAIEDGRM